MAKRSHEEPEASAEALAFRAAVRDVTPLARPASPPPAAPRTPRTPRKRAAPKSASDRDLDESMPLVDANVAAEENLTFRRPCVRERVQRHLRRGLFPVEDELDLHGLTQAGARGLLADFIQSCRARRCRCVRIIHGKGMRSGGRGAVLKSAVNDWLRRHHDVMAFCSAKAIDGGTGALYVLLRA